MLAFTAEAKAAEAAASAYYNPDNPHTVYMPTVGAGRSRAATGGWDLGVGRPWLGSNLLIDLSFLPHRTSLRPLPTTPRRIRRPSRPPRLLPLITHPRSFPSLGAGAGVGCWGGLVLPPGLTIKHLPGTGVDEKEGPLTGSCTPSSPHHPGPTRAQRTSSQHPGPSSGCGGPPVPVLL